MSSKKPMDFTHLVKACRTDQERAELSLLLAHAVLAFSAVMEQRDNKAGDVPIRAMLGCREACRQLMEETASPHNETPQ